jgi:hypothetical protein
MVQLSDVTSWVCTGSREKLPFLIAIYFTPFRLLIINQ